MNTPEELTRRHFMAGAARTCLGVSLAPALVNTFGTGMASAAMPLARPATAKRVIFLFMRGGMSHIDTLDPKPESKNVQGPVEAIKTSLTGERLSEHFPNLARHLHRGTLIRSMTSTQGAHPQAQYLLNTNYVKRGTIAHPHMSAWVSRMAGRINPTIPGSVVINQNIQNTSGYMETIHAALPISDPSKGLQNSARHDTISEEVFDKRLHLSDMLNEKFRQNFNNKDVRAYNAMYEEALKLMSSRDLSAFDISKEPAELRAMYGEDKFAQGCLLARRLIEHDVRYVEVNFGGWDTHNDNFETIAEKGAILDRALSALIGDLLRRGLLDETMIVLASEFGRTPEIVTARNGRNHYPKAFSAMLMGGGVKQGFIYGKTDKEAKTVIENPVQIEDLNATIAYSMGLSLDKIITSPSKRPFTIANKGKPVFELLA